MGMDFNKILEMIQTLKLKTSDLLILTESIRTLSEEVAEISHHLANVATITKGIIALIEQIKKRGD